MFHRCIAAVSSAWKATGPSISFATLPFRAYVCRSAFDAKGGGKAAGQDVLQEYGVGLTFPFQYVFDA